MQVRVTFTTEVFVEGDTMEEIKEKFEDLPIYSADALEEHGAEFIDVVSVEDEETNEDLLNEFLDA